MLPSTQKDMICNSKRTSNPLGELDTLPNSRPPYSAKLGQTLEPQACLYLKASRLDGDKGNMRTGYLLTGVLTSIIGLAAAGCASNAGNGALIGGATGAGLGAVIGHQSHGNTVGGAVVGGAVGAIAGALVGGEVDRQQAQQRAYDRPYEERYYYAEPPPRYYYSGPPRVYYEYHEGPYGGYYVERRYGY
jgi:hypothetical protein